MFVAEFAQNGVAGWGDERRDQRKLTLLLIGIGEVKFGEYGAVAGAAVHAFKHADGCERVALGLGEIFNLHVRARQQTEQARVLDGARAIGAHGRVGGVGQERNGGLRLRQTQVAATKHRLQLGQRVGLARELCGYGFRARIKQVAGAELVPFGALGVGAFEQRDDVAIHRCGFGRFRLRNTSLPQRDA